MKNIKNEGIFITFEGIDGSGKTTQIELLKNYLEEKKRETILTFEPGDCSLGKELRKILLNHKGFVDNTCELLLYLADRAQHTTTVIKKALEEGKVVLCDRFCDSTIAYQGYARGGDLEKIEFLCKIASNGLIPRLTFLFDLNPSIAQKRLKGEKDRLEKEGEEFFKKVKNGYLALAQKNSERIRVLDASLSVENIFSKIKAEVDKVL